MSGHKRHVMFSGGLPAETVEQVFSLLGTAIGARAVAYPDGEIGERRGWIVALNQHVFPLIGELNSDSSSLPKEHPYSVFRSFRIANKTQTPDLRGKLPYSRGAIDSYAIFCRMRDEGAIPAGVRFQVSIPAAHDAVVLSFPDTDDWPRMFEAWGLAMRDEFRRMLEVIPATDLSIQFDYCTELIHIGGALAKLAPWIPNKSQDELMTMYTSREYMSLHVSGLPSEVLLGFHICAGTYPQFPVVALDDIHLPVQVANALAKHVDRRVDYFHLPVLPESQTSYFEPLTLLDTGETTIYLGLECNDGLQNMVRRMNCAGEYLSNFGVAHYCGYLWNQEVMPELLSVLAAGADRPANG